MMYTTSILSVFGLVITSNAHMIMNTPVPYGKSSLTNSPLDGAGADFPCKQRTGVYDAEGASNSMALGSKQPLSFTGSATHGGGSCQISITYDKAPTKDSVFKVIHSIQGGCPIQGVAGNNGDNANAVDPSTYSFTIPTNLPTGDATLAWTWFNKIGNREMYMNCAPVTLTGGSSKRDNDLETRNATQFAERDIAAFNALPDMFVANIGPGCNTVDSTDLLFPNPGESVENLGMATSSALAAPSPTNACKVGAGSGSAPASSAPASSAPASSAAPSASPVASSATASEPAPTLPGGVFATSAPTTLATSVSPAAPTEPAASPVASSAPVATGTTGSGDALSGPCTTEGMWNCIGGTSFQQCASGSWSVVQPLAQGTKCTAGQSAAIDISAMKEKRAVRFANPHVRRHIQNQYSF